MRQVRSDLSDTYGKRGEQLLLPTPTSSFVEIAFDFDLKIKQLLLTAKYDYKNSNQQNSYRNRQHLLS